MESIFQNEYFVTTYSAIVYIACAFTLFFIGKVFYKLFHPKIEVDKELVIKDNFAFAVAHTGYYIGLVLAIGGAIIGESRGLLNDSIDIFVYGIVSIIILNLSTLINDKIILNKFCVRKEIIEDQNPGTGIIEAANAIASGLIVMGAVTGEADAYASGLLSLAIYWVVGQVILFITGKVYAAITPYDVHYEIEKDNVAAGLGFAGALIAIGILISNAIFGDASGHYVETAVEIGVEVILGFLLLPVARFLTDKILLPGQKLTDEIVNQEKPNVGAGLIEAFAYIAGAVLITWCI
jgi:uncharacterized membrane protein YjfL (UPF0719 family)